MTSIQLYVMPKVKSVEELHVLQVCAESAFNYNRHGKYEKSPFYNSRILSCTRLHLSTPCLNIDTRR